MLHATTRHLYSDRSGFDVLSDEDPSFEGAQVQVDDIIRTIRFAPSEFKFLIVATHNGSKRYAWVHEWELVVVHV